MRTDGRTCGRHRTPGTGWPPAAARWRPGRRSRTTPQHGLSSNKMALITSDCDTTRSMSIKWPYSPMALAALWDDFHRLRKLVLPDPCDGPERRQARRTIENPTRASATRSSHDLKFPHSLCHSFSCVSCGYRPMASQSHQRCAVSVRCAGVRAARALPTRRALSACRPPRLLRECGVWQRPAEAPSLEHLD